jgi:hypothetical protein
VTWQSEREAIQFGGVVLLYRSIGRAGFSKEALSSAQHKAVFVGILCLFTDETNHIQSSEKLAGRDKAQ